MLAERLIRALRETCTSYRVGGMPTNGWQVGEVETDEQVGSPEWLATLDEPAMFVFMLEANGRTLRVMVEDVTTTGLLT